MAHWVLTRAFYSQLQQPPRTVSQSGAATHHCCPLAHIPSYVLSSHLLGSIRCQNTFISLLKQQPKLASSCCLILWTVSVTRSHDTTWQPIIAWESSWINATSHSTYPYRCFPIQTTWASPSGLSITVSCISGEHLVEISYPPM